MNYYPKILPFYMTYPMPLIWEEEDTVMRDLEYLQELYPRQAKSTANGSKSCWNGLTVKAASFMMNIRTE